MQWVQQVASPPSQPSMIFDGDCDFCKFWIRRWQSATLDRVEYLALQDPRVMTQFPEIPRALFESAVHLIEPNGVVYHSAEAVLRSLRFNPRQQRWLRWYERSRLFARAAEWGYRLISQHRQFFYFTTRMLWRVPQTEAR